MKTAILTFIIFLCYAKGTVAQHTTPETILTVADGLPQSFVRDLVQDKTGFIWIGTHDGLARYDGKKFKNFSHFPGNNKTLADNIIENLYLDSHQQLWISYGQGSIDMLNTRTEALYHLTLDPVYAAVAGQATGGNPVVEDAKGNIWVRNANSTGFYICNLQQHTLDSVSATALGSSKILGVCFSKGVSYFMGDSSMLIKQAGSRRTMTYTFSNPHLLPTQRPWKDLSPLVRNSTGELISTDEERLIIYSPQTRRFITIQLPHRELYLHPAMTQDASGNVFFGYNLDIYKLNNHNELSIWRPGPTPYKEAICILADRSGMLWTGGNTTGLQGYDLRLPRISSYPYKDNFINDLFLSVLKVPENQLKKTALYNLKPYLFRWAEGIDQDYWLTASGNDTATAPLLYHLKDNRLESPSWHYAHDDTITHKLVNAVTKSDAGKIWGIDHSFRLLRFDPLTGLVTALPPIFGDNLPAQNTIISFVLDGEDTCWIATTHYGLLRYIISSKQLTGYMSRQQLFPQLTCMIEDRNHPGRLWLGSLSGGLISYNKKSSKYTIATTRDGLPNNTIYAMLQDRKGLIWCSSNRGIFSFDPDKRTVRTSYSMKDALSGEEFNRFHFFRLRDGRFLFGGIEGYAIFNPEVIVTDSFAPDVAITGIYVNNGSVDFSDEHPMFRQAINSLAEIRLPYDKNFISFDFAALEYNMPEKLQYRYKLVGLDKNWVDAGNLGTATYTGIPPGDYLLKITATNVAGKWSGKIKTIHIIISPPFWKTWWFTLCWCAVLAALVAALVRWQINSIRRKAHSKLVYERTVLELEAQALRAQMNPHFTFNCLNSIKALIQEDNGMQAVRYLTSFSRLVRSQMNSAKKEISLYHELETCKLYVEMEALRFGNRIQCSFNIDDEVDTHSLSVPPLIIQPLIENAIWHGVLPKPEGGNITISVRNEDRQIVCCIDDDGIGRALAETKRAFAHAHESQGLKLVQHRINLHDTLYHSGGKLIVIDKYDEQGNATGTRVCLLFKTEESD